MSVVKKICPIVLLSLVAVITVAATKATVSSKPPVQGKTYGDAIVGQVISVSDGSTFTVNLRDYPAIIGEQIPVKIYGIDTPDLRDSRREIRNLALHSRQVTANELRRAKIIKLKNMRRDKTFRIIADVEIDGHSLAKLLLEGGYAKPSFGDMKPKWDTTVKKP